MDLRCTWQGQETEEAKECDYMRNGLRYDADLVVLDDAWMDGWMAPRFFVKRRGAMQLL